MKKPLLTLTAMLAVTTLLVGISGTYIKIVVLQPLGLYQQESVLSVPFMLMADEGAKYILRAKMESERTPETEVTEPPPIVPATDPLSTEAPTEPEILPTEAAPEPIQLTEDWFDDTLFIGDSRTLGMCCTKRLGEADYFSKGSMSTFTVRYWSVTDRDFYDKRLQFVLENFEYTKIFIHLGLNECGYDHETVIDAYQELVDMIRQLKPDAAIIIQSVMSVSREKARDEQFSLERINNLNDLLYQLAEDNGLYYQDTNRFAADEEGYLRADITNDGCHPHNFGYEEWAEFILTASGELGIP